jgi:NitT/TauT family transport system permease protein
MSWAGGWFFLMAAEIFTVGSRDFRLPGIGAYLQTAASVGDIHSVIAGVVTLVFVIFLLDQLIWRPLLAWADKFKMEMVAGEAQPQSMVHNFLSRSWLLERFKDGIADPVMEWLDSRMARSKHEEDAIDLEGVHGARHARFLWFLGIVAGAIGLFGLYHVVLMMRFLHAGDWAEIGLGTLATFLRVCTALIIALAWTVPVGVAIGTNRRLAGILQPVVQVTASVPATALFPVIVLALVRLPGGLNIAGRQFLRTCAIRRRC